MSLQYYELLLVVVYEGRVVSLHVEDEQERSVSEGSPCSLIRPEG